MALGPRGTVADGIPRVGRSFTPRRRYRWRCSNNSPQTGTGHLPSDQVCVEITIPDAIAVETADASDIPDRDALDRRASRVFGGRWLTEARSCVLLIPSLIVPTERNVAINPAHPHFTRMTASPPRPLEWDDRLQKHLAGRRV